MSIVETRMCDQCEAQLASGPFPAWMTLSFPNQTSDAPQFDFCTYGCLEAWVNSEDTADEPEAALTAAPDVHERLVETSGVGGAPQPMPAMNLAQAIAMGLSPDHPV